MRVPFLVAAVTVLAASLAAHADTFDFSFGTTADAFNGSGVLTATLVAPGEYDVTAVSGTTDTGNGTNRPIAGIEAVGAFLGNDNLLFVDSTGSGSFDLDGLSYSLNNGAQINLYMSNGEFLERMGGTLVSENVPITITQVTPEPSSFLLLGTGLLGVAGTLRRRFV